MSAIALGLACAHCGSPVPGAAGETRPAFCCTGCRTVHRLLLEAGLSRYYELGGGRSVPAPEPLAERARAWLEALLARVEPQGRVARIELDVQGIHCAGCVWLMNELFRRRAGGLSLDVNPALGKVRLAYGPGFDVRGLVGAIERFGYRFGPSRKQADPGSQDLSIRLGVCAAITMNVMLLSVAFYMGLSPADAEVFRLFSELSLWLSAVVVLVGGWPFYKATWQGLANGLLHLDLPIALGILLSFGFSLVQSRWSPGDHAYLDTLDVFVTLMLAGRWLERRILDRNRRFLLKDEGADGIFVRRRQGERVAIVGAPEIARGDTLVLCPGDLVPVDAELAGAGSFSTDWITGETEVRSLAAGQTVPAGSLHAGLAAVTARALTAFDASPLPALLSATAPGKGRPSAQARIASAVAKRYVAVVLGTAAFGALLWLPAGPAAAIDVTVALLVVTCPCALGIALPMAGELARSRLRRAGLFARSADLLERLARVRKILFDKTGTLTLGRLELCDPESLLSLPPELREAAYDMTARSNHPVSRCLAAALASCGGPFREDARVIEEPGRGLVLDRDGRVIRLGAPSWAAPSSGSTAGCALSVNGELVASFEMRESVRPDARDEIALLQAQGLEVWLVSGDEKNRVAAMAHDLGVDERRALGGQSPRDKARTVASIDRDDTLFVGDGVNDSLAFERASCAGTPAIDRAVMPGRSDFFLLGDRIAAIRLALTLSKRHDQVVRRILAVAFTYNLGAVAACLAGWMTPLGAAVAMPASSIAILAFTVWSMSRRLA